MEARSVRVFRGAVSYHYSDWSRAETSIWILLTEQACYHNSPTVEQNVGGMISAGFTSSE